MSRICVKNLGKSTTEKQLKDLFGTKGEVTDVRIVKTKSGKTRQLAFLGFRTDVQAQEAISYFNNTFLETSRITVESAKKIGDQSLIDSTRSKITKKKLEKAAKEQSTEALKLKNDARLAAKKASTFKEPLSKEKQDFMEAMKPRRKTQFWANDESLPSNLANDETDIDVTTAANANYPAEDDDSDVDDDDINDFTNTVSSATDSSDKSEKSKKIAAMASSTSENLSKPSGGGSDMDYLRSKIKVNFSDDEASDDEDKMDEELDGSDDDSVAPVRGLRSGSKPSGAASSSMKPSEADDGSKTDMTSPASVVQVDSNDNDEYEDSGRLFVRNLTFSCTEDEIKNIFGTYGPVTAVHLPLDTEKKSKGFGFVQFMIPEQAQRAREELDGSSFQGRLLHIINAKKAIEIVPKDLDSGKTKLSSYQQKKEEERRKMANRTEGWNASFVRSDAVVDSLADRYGVSRSEILDRSESGGEMAVRLAIGEAHIIQENRDYFSAHGVDLGSLESHASNSKASARSTTTLLVKNLPHDVIEEEIESMFSRFGNIATLLIPKSKSVALIDFVEPTEARAAFKGLSYRKYHNVPIYLEWAPTGIIDKSKAALAKKALSAKKAQTEESEVNPTDGKKATNKKEKEAAEDEESYSTLFVKNLNFTTDEDGLKYHIENLGIKGLRTVSITKKTKGDYLLSTGFGFAEFKSSEAAGEALKKMDGSVLDGHSLQIKPSEKRLSKGSTGDGKGNKAKLVPKGAAAMKLIVRNLAFQATEGELKALFSSFGAVKRVRIPKKMGGVHRGFAFIDFSTIPEASAAMAALTNAHLYGRHLVIEYARDDDEDLDVLRKRAKLDEGAIKMDKKKRRIDDVIEEGTAGVGSDDM